MQDKVFIYIFIAIFILFIIFLLAVLITPVLYSRGKALWQLVSSREIYFALYLSGVTSLTSLVLTGLVGLPTGYVLARYDFFGYRFFDLLLDLPIILPPLVIGLSLLILVGPVLGEILGRAGVNFVFSVPGIVLAQFMVAAPLAIRSFRDAFSGVSPELEQAAMTLGDGRFRVFRRITLPLARQGIFSGLTTAWARALGEFGATMMLAGATRFQTETLPIAVYLNISTGDMDTAIAAAFVMLLLSAVALAVLKFLQPGIRGWKLNEFAECKCGKENRRHHH